jgi:protein phosphatase
MKLLVESVRNKLRMWHDGGSPNQEWRPAIEKSPSRRLSAPSQWLCAVTDVGRRRRNNEDEYFLSTDCRLWIVADGMGGHAAGEIASALTVQAIAKSVDSAGGETSVHDGAYISDRLMDAFALAQDWVSGCSLKDGNCKGMGSTAIAGVRHGEALHICHVGHVRAYHLSEGRLRHITNDHSWVWQELVMTGSLTSDQVRSHPKRRLLTQAIGALRGISPESTNVTLRAGDRILLCSDGLWEALADEEIGAVIGSRGPMRHLASALVDRANAAGGNDNITAVLYEHTSRAGG